MQAVTYLLHGGKTVPLHKKRSAWCRNPSALGVIHEVKESPSDMSGQAADSVNLKVNTVFNLGANLTDHDFKKPFEVNQLT